MDITKVTILAIFPNNRGFGYACLEWPNVPVDYAVITANPLTNAKLVTHFSTLLELLKPTVVLLRSAAEGQRCGKRNEKLLAEIAAMAESKNLKTYTYTREQIRYVFAQFGIESKYDIAKHIISEIPELEVYAPKKRKPWESENYTMGIFDAIALAVAHRYYG